MKLAIFISCLTIFRRYFKLLHTLFLALICLIAMPPLCHALAPDWRQVIDGPFVLFPEPSADNPVLTAEDITDVNAEFVADPFIMQDNGLWYMFLEILDIETDKGIIGVATSENGIQWSYDRVVLSEDIHLSFPQVLEHNGERYMIPETGEASEVRIYQANNFPYDWVHTATLLKGKPFVDPTVFHYNNKWWMFVSESTSSPNYGDCYLYYSDDLFTGWVEHPMSPIISNDKSKSRSAGRSFVFDTNRIIRLTMKNDIKYGQRIRAFEVDTLSETDYSEHELEESPLLEESGSGWNADGMHQLDPWWIGDKWLCAVDGNTEEIWSIGIYAGAVIPRIVTLPRVYGTIDRQYTYDADATAYPGADYSIQTGPNDMAIDGTSGNITWTPKSKGSFTVIVKASNLAGIDTQEFIIDVDEAHKITIHTEGNGSVLPAGDQTVLHGDPLTTSFIPDVGNYISDVVLDGHSLGGVSSYLFHNITQDHTLEVIFKKISYSIAATASGHGTISPEGTQSVSYGDSITFSMSPQQGHYLSKLMINNVDIEPAEEYTFSNIDGNQTISAEFSVDTGDYSSGAGGGGGGGCFLTSAAFSYPIVE